MENNDKLIKQLIKKIDLLESKVNFLLKEKNYNSETRSKVKRDRTKYLFEGKVYAKNQLVLAVVKAYVQDKDITFKEVEDAFSKSLQGSLGVVSLYEQVKNKKDASKRYYINDIINLKDNKVVVCTQWGAFNINKFLLRANQLGFKIEEV